MTLFITDKNPQRSCRHACLGQVIQETNCLLTADGSTINVWTIRDEKPYLHLLTQINLDDSISQLCTFPQEDRDWIIALVKDQVIALKVHDDLSHSKTIIPIDMVLGHLSALDTGPIMMSYTALDQFFLMIYRHSGFVSLLNLSLILFPCPSKPRSKRKREPDNPRAKTFKFGDITVVLMTLLKGNEPLLAVLYRDVDFFYSLRYYKLDMHLDNLIVEKQMEVFQGAPTHVYTASRGVVVVSDTKVWYFPPPTKQVTLESSAGDSVFPVTLNKLQNVITLNTSSLSKKLLGCKMNCSTTIDEKRQLIILDRGDALLLYSDIECLTALDKVVEFKIVELLKVTIASEVIHLRDNVFFASSKLSRSVLFRILPKPPYIGILETISDCLPILSVMGVPNRYGTSIAIARGGFSSGELSIISPFFSAKHVNSVSVSPEANSFEIFHKAKSTWLQLWALESPLNEYYSSSLAKVAKPESSPINPLRSQDYNSWRINDHETISVSKGAPIKMEYNSHQVVLTDFDQVSDLVWSRDELMIVFAALWNGKLAQIKFDNLGGDIISQSDLPFTGSVSLVHTQTLNHSNVLVALSSDGILHQMVFNDHRKLLCSTLRLPIKKGSFFRVSKPTKSSPLFIYNAFEVFKLARPANSFFFEPHSVLQSKLPILSCQADQHCIIVLFTEGTLSRFEIINKAPSLSYFSSKLIKTLETYSDEYILALEVEERPNQSTGRIDYISFILLFDQRSLKLLDTYQADPKDKFVDICVMDINLLENQAPIIVVANSGGPAQRLLPVFHVKDGKLSEPEYYKMNGCFSRNTSIVKFSRHNQRLVLVGTSITIVELDSFNSSRSWNGSTLAGNTGMYFGVDIAINEFCTVYADVSRGIFFSCEFGSTFTPLQIKVAPNFVTAIALFKHKPILLYGDSVGNVGGVSIDLKDAKQNLGPLCGQKTEQLFAFNVDSAVNSLCIILESPICFLVGTTTGKLFEIRDLTLPKLILESLEQGQDLTSWKTLDKTSMDVDDGESCSVYSGTNFSKLVESTDISIKDKLNLAVTIYNFHRSF